MSTGAKATIIIVCGAISLYFMIFLISVPAMSSRSPMAQAMGAHIYANMYRPLRDILPKGYIVRELWQDYEDYWCSGARSCKQ